MIVKERCLTSCLARAVVPFAASLCCCDGLNIQENKLSCKRGYLYLIVFVLFVIVFKVNLFCYSTSYPQENWL